MRLVSLIGSGPQVFTHFQITSLTLTKTPQCSIPTQLQSQATLNTGTGSNTIVNLIGIYIHKQ